MVGGTDRAHPAHARTTPLVAPSTLMTAANPASPGRRPSAPRAERPPLSWTLVRPGRRRLQRRGGASARLEQSDTRPC